MLKQFLEKIKGKRERFREYKEDYEVRRTLDKQMKSPEERELDDYKERERQERIKKELVKRRLNEYRRNNKAYMFTSKTPKLKGNSMMKSKYLFKSGGAKWSNNPSYL